MMPTRPRRSPRPPRSLVWFAALAVVLGAAAVALIATGQRGRLLSLSPENLSFAPIDISQLGAAFERGALPVELLIIGAAVALAVGTALPLLAAAVRRRGSTALSGAAPVEATEPLEARTTLPWPIEDAAPYSAVRTQSPAAFDVDPHAARLPSAALHAAEAEALAAREAAADVAVLTHALAETRVGDPWSQVEQLPSPEVARHRTPPASTTTSERPSAPETRADFEPRNGTVEAWRRTEAPLSTADPAAIAPARAPHPAVTRPAQPKIVTAEKPLEGEPREAGENARPGPNLPRVAAVATVAVGIAFSAGSAIGAALGAGVGAAIGLAFAGGAGAAIGATVTLLGARRS